MIFTAQQLEDILKIIDANVIRFSVGVLGPSILTKDDKKILQRFGINLKEITKVFPNYEKMYQFGKLSEILGNYNASRLSYNQFTQYLQKGQYLPLSPVERNMLEISKQRTYSHIKGLGSSIKRDITNIVNNQNDATRDAYENIIKEKISRGIQDRQSLAEIVSEIGHTTGDWQRDMGRIVDTEMNNIMQEGRSRVIKDRSGDDAKVYKDVYPGACRHCIRLYLTNGIGSEPIVFSLKKLTANGDNVGKKVKNWVPTLGAVHPWCRCTLHEYKDKYIWDKDKQMFVPKAIDEKAPKLGIKITVGDKVYNI